MGNESSRSQLDLLLLAVLRQGPGHGYAVIEGVRRLSGGALELAEGSVYPALHRLERERLLDSDWSEVNGRRRRVYRLTARGARRLRTEEAEWRRWVRAVAGVLGGQALGEVPA